MCLNILDTGVLMNMYVLMIDPYIYAFWCLCVPIGDITNKTLNIAYTEQLTSCLPKYGVFN